MHESIIEGRQNQNKIQVAVASICTTGTSHEGRKIKNGGQRAQVKLGSMMV
jgi:ABC-type uncharacterized transport system YnjBCD ATPase subunit